MSQLTVLSDVELDTVSGGLLNAGDGGAGGSGGTASNGAYLSITRAGVEVERSNLSVNGSTANANGGTGGAGGSVTINLGSRHR